MLKPKVGDMVRLKPMPVDFVFSDDQFATHGIGAGVNTFKIDDIEEILPRPFAIGDKVYVGKHIPMYEIIGLNGDEVWLKPINASTSRIQNITAKIEDLIDPS